MAAGDDANQASRVRALTAELHAASEKIATLSRETSRSRIVAALVRSIHQLGVGSPIADDLAPRFLQVVIEHALCDTAVLLQGKGTHGEFVTIEAIGHRLQSRSEELILPGIPSFLALPGGSCPSHVVTELRRAYGQGSILWSLHSDSGLALLLSSKMNATIRQDYTAADRELMETALSLYVGSLSQRRVNRSLVQSKQLAESRSHSCRTMVIELLDLLEVKLEQDSLNPSSDSGIRRFDELWLSVQQAVELIKLSRDMVCAEDIPLSVDPSWVEVNDVIASVSTSLHKQAVGLGVSIDTPCRHGKIVALVDPGWVREILCKVLSETLNEAASGSTVVVTSARRSENAISVTIGWRHLQRERLPSWATRLDVLQEQPISGWGNSDLVRLINAYGGMLIREVTGADTAQVVLTFPTNN